jgi:branched-chain amino acid aminotransferase
MGVAPGKTKPHLAIAAWEWGKYYEPRFSNEGIRLDIARYRRPAPYTAPTESKASGLYMICTLSKQHAEQRGYNDALMFDWRGRVAEATGANVFFVRENELHTPTPDCFLDGITRRTVMDLAERRVVAVKERAIWPEELVTFEQMFLTGTAVEVTPVKSAGPWNFEVGDLTRQLAKDYDDVVHGRIPNE